MEKSINDEAGISNNTVSTNSSFSNNGGFSLNNLEDSPCSEEQRIEFLQRQSLLEQRTAEKMKNRKTSGTKLSDDPTVAATLKQLEQRVAK